MPIPTRTSRAACAALLIFALAGCDRSPSGAGRAADSGPPAAPAVVRPPERDVLRKSLEADSPALLKDYDALGRIHASWPRCGLPAFDDGPILEQLIRSAAAPDTVASRLRRLRTLDAGPGGMAASAAPVTECEGWRLAAGRDWLVAHPPNPWAAAPITKDKPPGAVAASPAEERQWHEIEARVAERDLRLAESVKALLSALDVLALCHVDANGDRALAKMLDARAHPAPASGASPIDSAQRAEVERYFHIRQKVDRYGRQVYAEMGLADRYRANSCTPDGIRLARSMVDALGRG